MAQFEVHNKYKEKVDEAMEAYVDGGIRSCAEKVATAIVTEQEAVMVDPIYLLALLKLADEAAEWRKCSVQ